MAVCQLFVEALKTVLNTHLANMRSGQKPIKDNITFKISQFLNNGATLILMGLEITMYFKLLYYVVKVLIGVWLH